MKKIACWSFGVSWALFLGQFSVCANPLNGVVSSGAATILNSGNLLTVSQTSGRAIINWGSFNIGAGETTLFQFNGAAGANSVVLNRVNIGNPSVIAGMLRSTIGPNGPVGGTVMILNPSGILFMPGAQISVGGLVATTLNLANPEDSLGQGGPLRFTGNSTAGVENRGSISALGDVYMIAHTVRNSGQINAGNVAGLAAGSDVTLVQGGSEHLSVQAGIPGTGAAVGVENTVGGTINAVSAELKAAGGNIYALAINNGGAVRATGIVNNNGRISLRAGGGNIQNTGSLIAQNADGSGGRIVVDAGHNADSPATVLDSGTISARGDAAGTKGGAVQIIGDHVGLFDDALVDVSGDAGGGTAQIGGGFHGANPDVANAQAAYVGPNAQIKADALTRGNGGDVVVWSDDTTRFYGSVSAQGGAIAGNGGRVEISGARSLDFQGSFDALAPHGRAGSLLLDPFTDLTIDNSADNNVSGGPAGPTTFEPNGGGSVLTWTSIKNALTGGDVTVTTSGSPDNGQAGDINVNAASGNLGSTRTLSLDAVGALNVNASIQNNSGGDLSFTAAGGIKLNANVSTTGGGLAINSALDASGGGTLSGATLTLTGSGNVGSSGNRLNTTVTALVDNKSGGDTFITEANGLTLSGTLTGGNLDLAETAGATTLAAGGFDAASGNVTLGGAVTASAGTLSGGTLTLNGDGNVGSSGTRLKTSVANLADNKSSGDTFVNEADGLTLSGTVTGGNLDLVDGGTTTLAAGGLNAGAGNVTLDGAVAGSSGTLSGDTLTLTGNGNVGSSGTHLNTAVGNLVDNKSAGDAFITEADGLTLSGTLTGGNLDLAETAGSTTLAAGGFNAGAGNVTLGGGVVGSAGTLTAGTLTLNGGNNVGSPGTRLQTDVAALVDNKSGGDTFVNEANGLTLSGTMTGGNLDLVDGGATTLAAGGLNAGGGNVALDGAVVGSAGTLSGGTLTLTGNGNVGSGGTRLNTAVGALVDNKTAGDTFISEADGLTLSGTLGGGNLDLVDAGATTLSGAGFNAGAGNVSLDGAVIGSAGTLSGGTLTLAGNGNVGSSGARLSTDVNALVDNKTGGNTFVSEANGLTLSGTFSGGDLDLTDAGATTLAAGGLNAGAGNVTLGGAVIGSAGTIAASSLTLNGSGNVGSGGTRLNTAVNSLVDNKSSGDTFINEADGLTLLGTLTGGNLDLFDVGATTLSGAGFDAGAGNVTLYGAVIASAGTLSANTLTLNGNGNVGASGARLNTAIATLADNKTAGDTFISEADGLTLSGALTGGNLDVVDAGTTTLSAGGFNAGAGNVTLAGAVAGSAGTLSGGTLNLNGGGNVGSSGTRLNTALTALVDNKSGGNTFISEADGLTLSGTLTGGNLDLVDAGATTLSAGGFNAGGGDVTLGGAVVASAGSLSANTLTLNGNGNVGSGGTRLNTAVASLVDNKSGGDTYVSEADGLTLSGALTGGNLDLNDAGATTLSAGGFNAGGGNVTLGGAVVASAGTLAGGTLTLNGNGNVGSSGTRLNTAVTALVDNKTGGDTFASEADGLTLSGTFSGGNLDLTDAGATTLAAGGLNAGAGNVTLGGAVIGSAGTLSANALALNGSGDVGSSGTALNTKVNSIALNRSGGDTFINQDAGTTVDLRGTTSGGDLTLTAGAATVDNQSLNTGSGDITFNVTTLSLTKNVTGGSLLVNNSGNASLATSIHTTGNQQFNGPVLLTGNTDLHGNALILGSGLNAQNHDLLLDFSTPFTIPGTLVNVHNFTSSRNINLNGNFTTSGSQTYNGQVVLLNSSTLQGSSVALNNGLSGSGDFAIVGAASMRGTITTSGAQTYSSPISLTGDTSMHGSQIHLNGVAGGGFNFTVGSTAGTLLTGPIGGVRNFTESGPIMISVPGGGSEDSPAIITTGLQTFNGLITLGADATLVGTGFDPAGGLAANGYRFAFIYILPNGKFLNTGSLFDAVAETDRRVLATIQPQLYRPSVGKLSITGTGLEIPGIYLRSSEVPVAMQ